MPSYRPYSRYIDNTNLAKALVELGYPQPLSPNQSPHTVFKAAIRDYQQKNSLMVDGLMGPQTLGAMAADLPRFEPADVGGQPTVDPFEKYRTVDQGPAPTPVTAAGPAVSATPGATSGGGTDYTTPTSTRFNGLPGHPEMWRNTDTGQTYVVYHVPDVEPPIPLLFTVASTEDLGTFFGDKPPTMDKSFTQTQIDSFGSMLWGSTDTIPDREGDPFAGFVERLKRATEVQPWLDDDEVWAVYAGAWLEDRAVENWELAATDYWQGLNQAERQWIEVSASDPSQSQRIVESNRIRISDMFRDLGVEEIDDKIVDYMADQLSTGKWSDPYLQEQIWIMTGSMSDEPLDGSLNMFLSDETLTVPDTEFMTTNVKDLFNQWLGPNFPPTENQLKEWTAKMRRSPQQTKDGLTEYLRSQRLALFPEYEDDALTYQDIAAPWRSFTENMWGQTIDETDSTFLKVLRLNDATEAGKLLRREGIERNIGAVRQEMITGVEAQTQRVVNPI